MTARGSADGRSISVPGRGEVRVAPDTATVRVSVRTVAPDVTAARTDSDACMARLRAAARELGVADEGIVTQCVKIEPCAGTQEKGYVVERVVEFLIRQPDRVQPLITRLFEAGASRLEAVRYGTSKAARYRQEALRLAVQDARARAARLAPMLAEHVGLPLSIVEETAGPSIDGPWSEAPLRILVSASIRVTFELKPKGRELLKAVHSVLP